jgi:hypothetical protein
MAEYLAHVRGEKSDGKLFQSEGDVTLTATGITEGGGSREGTDDRHRWDAMVDDRRW